ncbi:MAG: circularly permuted type 2 ATP-grasp protein, partial [Bdellovibrionales bacterium]|nr:circularly permuted type 2 ATP-grasp protein [Bdellovibrionales bacterium]
VPPRVVTEEENAVLRAGVAQRGLAIRAFLEDYNAGNDRVIHRLIPKDVLARIVARSGEFGWRGQLAPGSIAFPYGPDIIRAPDGSWRVVEDNHGYIGGMGDLIRAREALYRRMPEYAELLEARTDPEQFYKDLVTRYREMANPRGGKIVLFSMPPYPDNEDYRLKKIMNDQGVEVVTPHTKKKLEADKDGAWLVEEGRRRERVGYVHLNDEHKWLDPKGTDGDLVARVETIRTLLKEPDLDPGLRYVLEDAIRPVGKAGKPDANLVRVVFEFTGQERKFRSHMEWKIPGLLEAMARGRVATNFSPGIEFIGDKEFYLYVESLVRHYRKEEPILRSIPTQRFARFTAEGFVLDKALLQKVMKDPARYVIKAVDGRGGDAVWVGAKIPPREFRAVARKIEADPSVYIVQEYTALSRIGDKIGDIRGLSLIDRKGAVVTETFWARALPASGDGKVNISAHGREMAVVVVKGRKGCEESFARIRP